MGGFRWGASGAIFVQLAAEASWIVVAAVVAIRLFVGRDLASVLNELEPALFMAVLMVALGGVFGLYRRDRRLPVTTYVLRLMIAMTIATPIAYSFAGLVPGGDAFRYAVEKVVVLAFCGLIIVRLAIVGPILRALSPHRVLVLGTGADALAVEASFAHAGPGMQLVGFYPLEKMPVCLVAAKSLVSKAGTLDETARRLGINEIIVAVREQRGGVLPLRHLLECRLRGIKVTDLSRFFETVEGCIPIDALKASWLIYGHGFRQNWLRALVKRIFDVLVSTTLLILTLPIMAVTAFLIAMEGAGPVIYRQERVGYRGKTFDVLKFRSMRPNAEKGGVAQWAAVGDARVTPLGRFIRRARIDELPQLLNVLKGEMSFVGPRPERPYFVSLLTEQIPFYAVRHSVKPGLTGWAQVRYSYGASVEQALRKLEFDLFYVKNHTLILDFIILFKTVRVVLVGQGAR